MSSPFNTKAFRDLKKVWDQKLADSGFVDVEARDLEKDLKRHAIERGPIENHSRELYFSYAGEYLYAATWVGSLDRRIWELHCEGLSMRAIAHSIGQGHRLVQCRIEKHRRLMWDYIGSLK